MTKKEQETRAGGLPSPSSLLLSCPPILCAKSPRCFQTCKREGEEHGEVDGAGAQEREELKKVAARLTLENEELRRWARAADQHSRELAGRGPVVVIGEFCARRSPRSVLIGGLRRGPREGDERVSEGGASLGRVREGRHPNLNDLFARKPEKLTSAS